MESPIRVSLAPLYEWAARRGYQVEQAHIVISGVPVQIIPAHNDLAEAAVRGSIRDGPSVFCACH